MILLLSLNALSQENPTEAADALYMQGDCEKAVTVYKELQSKETDALKKDFYLFRISYCQLNVGNYTEAEAGFRAYLKNNPHDETARLKYSQALLYQGKYHIAKNAAIPIKQSDLIAEAAIVRGRAHTELEDYQKAIETLLPMAAEENHNPEINYWLGVAYYKSDSDDLAEKNFREAEQKANESSWVKKEAQSWLERIKQDQRRFHIQLAVGGLNDTNIDQSGSAVAINPTPGGPNPGDKNKVSSAANNYTNDIGGYLDLDLIYNTYWSRKYYWITTFSMSSPFYSKNASYNLQSISLDFSFKAIPTNSFLYGTSLKYLYTLYAGNFYQDYGILDPYVSWSPLSGLWLKLSYPVTAYLNNKKTYLQGPALDISYEVLSWFYVSIGGGATKSSAPKAVIVDVPPPTVTSGTLFSRYTSAGAYFGFGFSLPADIELSVSASQYTTKYESETLPSSGPEPKPREDILKTYQVNVSKSLLKDIWWLTWSYSYYDNKSDGFPGLASAGSITNNTYTRGYTLLTTTWYY